MLSPRFMLDLVAAEPFRPFRIHMASSRTFDVRHPEMIEIGRSAVTIHMLPDSGSNTVDHWQKVSYMLLESVEPFEVASPIGSP